MIKTLSMTILSFGLALMGAIFIGAIYVSVSASTISWAADEKVKIIINDTSEVTYRSDVIGQRQCVRQRIAVQGEFNLQDVCFTHGSALSYGFYKTIYGTWAGVVKYKGDSKSYRVSGIGHPERTAVISGTDTLISLHYRSQGGRNFVLSIQKNVSRALVKTRSDIGITESYNIGDSNLMFNSNEEGYAWPVTAVNYSNNGRWLVANVTNIGMIRFDLEAGKITRFSHLGLSYIAPLQPALDLSLAISNDGQYASVGGDGHGVPFKIYSINDECAEDFSSMTPSTTPPMVKPCTELDLRQQVNARLSDGYSYEKNISFSDDGGVVNFYAYQAETQTGKWVEVQPSDYVRVTLDYLAMGDSYSSGEGDTQVVGGAKFYLPGTDIDGDDLTPREKCHVSSRSYPFLLKNMMGIADDRMESIACSGAKVSEDYIERMNYLGQGSVLNILPNEINIQNYKDRALDDFIPGRIEQLQFIEKYKPQSVTITGTGNDVGFGDVLKSCIMSTYYGCIYHTTQPGRAAIGQGIANQYYELTALFAKIKDISPNTKIYMIGYPQFVDTESFICAANVPFSQGERAMISEAVTYLNLVIKSAAESSGVMFVDIENSLSGHKLCEKGVSYVTGLAMSRKLGNNTDLIGESEEQESFHPNRNGHAAIAEVIKKALDSQSLLTYSDYPKAGGYQQLGAPIDPPLYFADSMTNSTKHYQKGTIANREYVYKSPSIDELNISYAGFEPRSQVAIEIHSDPVDLGVYSTDENGLLSINVPVPHDIPAGYHTIHLIGRSYSGEEIDVRQGIEVRGAAGDIDEDGIIDNDDQCIYITASGLDYDYDNIDDACDPIIEEEREKQASVAVVSISDSRIHTTGRDLKDDMLSNQSSPNVQRQIENLFYRPYQYERTNTLNDKSLTASVYVLIGAIVTSLILYWVIKVYSNRSVV